MSQHILMSEAGDLGRRIATRREQLNLSTEQVAASAGMEPGYVEYVEENPAAHVSIEALCKLSQALKLSTLDLLGGEHGRAPGKAYAAHAPRLVELGSKECAGLLEAGGIGRAVFCTAGRPLALPVNFKMLEGNVVFRSSDDGQVSAIQPAEIIGFEVDRIDEAMSAGWSVLGSGTLHPVREPGELRRVEALGDEPWAGRDRGTYFLLEISTLSGRRIAAA